MENKNQEYGIFENVQFLNEGAFLRTLIFLGATIIIGSVIKGKIDRFCDEKQIKKGLENLKADKNTSNFAKKVDGIRFIKKDSFLEKVDADKNASYALSSSDCSILIMEDDKGDILSYAIFDTSSAKCVYGFVDKSINENTKKYIGAMFEYRFGVYGDNLKSITKKLNYTYNNKKLKDTRANENSTNINNLSEQEKTKLQNDLKKISNELAKFLKSKCSKYEVNVEFNSDYSLNKNGPKDYDYYCFISVSDPREPDMMTNEDAYDAYYASNKPNEFTNDINSAIEEIEKKFNIISNDYGTTFKGTPDSYPYVFIDYYGPDEKMCGALYIKTVFD